MSPVLPPERIAHLGTAGGFLRCGISPRLMTAQERCCSRRSTQLFLLWELGNQFEKFGLRPSPDGSGTHVSQRAEREREFRNVVPTRGIDNEKEVIVARS